MTELLPELRQGESVMFHGRLVVDSVLARLLVRLLVIIQQGSDIRRVEHWLGRCGCVGRSSSTLAVMAMPEAEINSLKAIKFYFVWLIEIGSKRIEQDVNLHAAELGIDLVKTLFDRYV